MTAELDELFGLSKKFGKQNFRDILEHSCHYKIIEVDMGNTDDKQMIESIAKAMRNFLNAAKNEP
mgnify:CR=1 FL=1